MSVFDAILGNDPGKRYTDAAMNEYAQIQAPSEQDLRVQLQQMVYQGDITPEMAQTILQDPSKFNEITTGGAGRQAQLQALSQLQGISTGGGRTAEDKANLNEIQSATGAQERGAREAIMMNARERGVGGSGLEIASQLINQQGSAGNANQAGLDVAAQAQKRALEAIMQSGQLGGQIQGQEFSEAAQKAAAQDTINRFNAANSQAVVNANTLAKNQAQERNMGMKQDLSNQNTAIANDQEVRNKQAKQQAFDNLMGKAQGVAGQYGNMAQGAQNAQNAQLGFLGGLAGAAGSAYGGYLSGKKKPVAG